MTGYKDFQAPVLSDFLMERRPTADDGYWPFGKSFGPVLRSGDIWNNSVNYFDATGPDPALRYNAQWVNVVFGLSGNSEQKCGNVMSHNLAGASGTPEQRQQQLMDEVVASGESLGMSGIEFDEWVHDTGYTNTTMMRHMVNTIWPMCSMTQDVGDMRDDLTLMVTADGLRGKSDWKETVQAYIDDGIENNGWRFMKLWQTVPEVHPCFYPTGGGQNWAYLMDMETRAEVVNGVTKQVNYCTHVDCTSLWSARKGEKVRWMRRVQSQDIRDPNDPYYLTTPEHHTLQFGSSAGHRLRISPETRGIPLTGWKTYYFCETLDGHRPTTADEMRTMVGVDNSTPSVPGLIGMQGSGEGFFDWWGGEDGTYGGGQYPERQNHAMRLYGLVVPSDFIMAGRSSMEDCFEEENVKLAWTFELYPYSEVGPAAQSRFGPTFFMAQPNAQARIRLETAWDGGGP